MRWVRSPRNEAKPPRQITKHQWDAIIRLYFTEGWTQVRIAYALELSPRTVGTYCRHHWREQKITKNQVRVVQQREAAKKRRNNLPDAPTWPIVCPQCSVTVLFESDWLGRIHQVCKCPRSKEAA